MKCKQLAVAVVAVLALAMLLVVPVLASAGFVKYAGNPVLLNGPSAWESQLVGTCSVILEGATYKMWYSGQDSNGIYRIGYATSPDGKAWTKYGNNPVLNVGAVGAWDADAVTTPCVINDGGTYKMWYTGINSLVAQIGYATSPDGTTWTKFGGNPILSSGGGGSWDSSGVASPSVINDGGTYKMWYTGRFNDGTMLGLVSIGYATSPNGTTWTKSLFNPVLVKSATSTDFDGRGVGSCDVIKDGATFTMYYTGFANSGVYSRIGKAYSPDGIAWGKWGSNPVLDAGSSGSWEERGVASPWVLIVGGATKMWYSGSTNDLLLKIGYAEQPPNVPASSNLSLVLIIGGFAVMMAVVLWSVRRYQFRI